MTYAISTTRCWDTTWNAAISVTWHGTNREDPSMEFCQSMPHFRPYHKLNIGKTQSIEIQWVSIWGTYQLFVMTVILTSWVCIDVFQSNYCHWSWFRMIDVYINVLFGITPHMDTCAASCQSLVNMWGIYAPRACVLISADNGLWRVLV